MCPWVHTRRSLSKFLSLWYMDVPGTQMPSENRSVRRQSPYILDSLLFSFGSFKFLDRRHLNLWIKQMKAIYREHVYSFAVYQKISNEVGRIDNFRALARKLSFLPTKKYIFDIQQHYVRILFIIQRLIC